MDTQNTYIMDTQQVSSGKTNIVNAFIVSAIVAVVFIAIIVVWAELYAPLKGWLKSSFGHHWVGKGVLASAIYFVLGGILSFVMPDDERYTRRLFLLLLWTIILGFAAISGFYVYEAFFVHPG